MAAKWTNFNLRRKAHGATHARMFMGHSFNQASFDQSLVRVKSADSPVLEAEVLKVMSETVATLTPDELRAFAEKVKEHNRPWWRRLGMDHDH